MTTTETRPLLAPTNNPTPVEKAVAQSILDNFDPEMFLTFVFKLPNGGCRSWHGWTTGGHQLGDDADRQASTADMDAIDWFEISGRHVQTSSRGRVEISSYPLRPVLADVQAGVRGDDDLRARLRKFVTGYCDHYGQPHPPAERRIPWLGFGPTLRNKQH